MPAWKRVLWGAAVAAILQGGACRGRQPVDPLDDLLGRLSRQARSLRRFSMAFTEEKTLPEIRGTVLVKGRLWGRADAEGLWLRLEADSPRPSSVLITPRELRVHSPVERQFEIAPLERAPDFAGLMRGFSLLYAAERKDLERDFEIRLVEEPAGTIRAELTPRASARPFLEGPIEIAWRGPDAALAGIRFRTAAGEEYRWSFEGHGREGEPPGGFSLEPPPGVSTVDLTRWE